MDDLEALLEGPTAVAFVEGDAVAAAKKVVEAIKQFPALVLKGGFMDGRMLSADDARALADLESREAMLSKIAGLMKGGDVARRRDVPVGAVEVRLAHGGPKEKLPPEAASEPEADAADAPASEAEAPPAEAAVAAEPEAEAAAAPEGPRGRGSDRPRDAATDVTDDQSTDAAAPAEGEE